MQAQICVAFVQPLHKARSRGDSRILLAKQSLVVRSLLSFRRDTSRPKTNHKTRGPILLIGAIRKCKLKHALPLCNIETRHASREYSGISVVQSNPWWLGGSSTARKPKEKTSTSML